MQTRQVSIGKARNAVASDMRSLLVHTEQLLQATATASGNGIEAVRERLLDSVKRARAQVTALEADAVARGRVAIEQTAVLVRERPWQALAAAALFGALLARLTATPRVVVPTRA